MLGSCRIFVGSVRHSSSDASVTSLMGTTETVRFRLLFFLRFVSGTPTPLGSPDELVVEISPAEGLAGDKTMVGDDTDPPVVEVSVVSEGGFRRRRKRFNLSR